MTDLQQKCEIVFDEYFYHSKIAKELLKSEIRTTLYYDYATTKPKMRLFFTFRYSPSPNLLTQAITPIDFTQLSPNVQLIAFIEHGAYAGYRVAPEKGSHYRIFNK